MHREGLRAALLLGAITALILLFGALFDVLVIAAVAVIAVNAYAFLNSGRGALRAMRARPVSEAEQPALYRVVRDLATKARTPMPQLYISATAAPNAFAVGRGPRSAAICCTTGLLELLDERELRGVLAHELSHVSHRDTLAAGVAGALAGAVGLVAGAAAVSGLFGDDEDDNPIALLAVAVLSPVAATMVRLAVSRTREYRADAEAARLTGDPLGLASALDKLDRGTRVAPLAPQPALLSQAHVMIANPFPAGARQARRFATHPPMAERVRRLSR
ncbi:M48 family metalloprotease [Actinokineospora sp. 24-640]